MRVIVRVRCEGAGEWLVVRVRVRCEGAGEWLVVRVRVRCEGEGHHPRLLQRDLTSISQQPLLSSTCMHEEVAHVDMHTCIRACCSEISRASASSLDLADAIAMPAFTCKYALMRVLVRMHACAHKRARAGARMHRIGGHMRSNARVHTLA